MDDGRTGHKKPEEKTEETEMEASESYTLTRQRCFRTIGSGSDWREADLAFHYKIRDIF